MFKRFSDVQFVIWHATHIEDELSQEGQSVKYCATDTL